MKMLLYIFLLGATLLPGQPILAQNMQSGVTYQAFYNELQPYGNWINYPGYGYVWQPAMGKSFRPYETNGYWVSTVDGWAWASDYSWGWAPFHYGRWLLEPALGWVWVPGYEWAPAWVQWGSNNKYYGWAPLSPGITLGTGNSWMAPSNYWCYVPHNYIRHRNINRYIVRSHVKNIVIINNYNTYNQKDYYHRGPQNGEVEKFTHRPVKPMAITASNSPGKTKAYSKFEIYRPRVTNVGNVKAVPEKVKSIEEIKIEQNRSNSIMSVRGIKPAGSGTKAAVKGNTEMKSNLTKPVKQTTGGSRTTILHTPISPQNQPPLPNAVKGDNGIMEQPGEQLPPSPPIKTGGIKPPPPDDNSIITKLPPPVDPKKMQHRNDPDNKVTNQPSNGLPVTKPVQIVKPVRPVGGVN